MMVVWTGLRLIGEYRLGDCDTACMTPVDYYRQDPLCIVDPTCVSPMYRPYADGVQRWVGVAGWRVDQGQLPPPGAQAFSLPNYVAFLVLMMLNVAVTRRLTRQMRCERYLLFAVGAWVLLEVGRWFFDLTWLDQTFDLEVLLEAVVVLVTTALLFAWSVKGRLVTGCS